MTRDYIFFFFLFLSLPFPPPPPLSSPLSVGGAVSSFFSPTPKKARTQNPKPKSKPKLSRHLAWPGLSWSGGVWVLSFIFLTHLLVSLGMALLDSGANAPETV